MLTHCFHLYAFSNRVSEEVACLKTGGNVLFSEVEDFGEEVGGGSGISKEVDTGSRLEMIFLLHCSWTWL
jgi:hypothetical protein